MRAFYVPLALRFVVPSAGSSALNGDPVNLLSFQFQRAKPAEIPSKSDAASSGSFPTTDVISKKNHPSAWLPLRSAWNGSSTLMAITKI
jgi:hypothetical protein